MTARNKKIRTILCVSMLTASLACAFVTQLPVLQNMTSIEAQAAEDDSDALTAEKTDGTTSDYTIPSSLSDERKEVLLAALSLEGQITYTWGGKATSTGWNSRWSSGSGLDCSGFVQWAYWTGIGIKSGLGSTAQISYSYSAIDESELQPGDLGLIFKGGSGYEAENGKIYETEAEATEANLKKASRVVNRQIKGKEEVTTSAIRKAKKAEETYRTAVANAGGTERKQAEKYEKKASEAKQEAADLIEEAKEYESQAAAYLSTVSAQSVTALSLQTFASVTEDGSASEESSAGSDSADTSAQEDTAGTNSSSESSSGNSSDGSSDTEASSDSASDSTGTDSSGDSGTGSSDSGSSSDASSKAASLTEKAEALRAEAAALQEKADSWSKKAKALRKTAKTKRSNASVKLSKLKKKASIAKSEAVTDLADSYEVSLEANHVGIYVGTDDNGNQLWVHCNSSENTVSVNSVGYFTYFVRVISNEHYTTVDEGDISVNDAKKRSKARRMIEKMIEEHALYKVVLEKFEEEESPTACAEEQQQAAVNVLSDEQNA